MANAIRYTEAHEAAAGSLAKHLGIECPLPYIVNQTIEWHLKQRDELTKKLLGILYRNDHKSYEDKVREALGVTKK